MHEASLALNILDTVTRQCEQGGYRVVHSIRLRVGRASHVLPEALTFAFDALKANTVAANASLEIESIPLGGHCRTCGARFEASERFIFACPDCQGSALEITQGHELDILDMDVD